jgi:hypothetical protein
VLAPGRRARSRSTARRPERLDLQRFGAVIFAGGLRPDHTGWLRLPDAFDALGFPLHQDSTPSRTGAPNA